MVVVVEVLVVVVVVGNGNGRNVVVVASVVDSAVAVVGIELVVGLVVTGGVEVAEREL